MPGKDSGIRAVQGRPDPPQAQWRPIICRAAAYLNPTAKFAACSLWIAAVADTVCFHGGSLSPVRPPLPHRFGADETGQTAPAGPLIQAGWRGVEQTSIPQSGQSAVFLDDKLLPSTFDVVE